MLRSSFTLVALASIAAVSYADQLASDSMVIIGETATAVEAETDSTLTIDLSRLDEANMSQLSQTGVPMQVGDSLTFSVRGNPTTGYTWNVRDEAANGVFSVEKTYKVDEADPSYTGVPGTYYFTLTAGNAAGSGDFSIWHGRTWESEQNSLQSFTIPIHIH